MTLIHGLKSDIKKAGLDEEYSVHNNKGFLESILDNAFVVDFQKAIVKNKSRKIVLRATLSHGFLKIHPRITELEFLRFEGWISNSEGQTK